MCISQGGQLTNGQKNTIESEIRALSFREFAEDTDLNWVDIPIGDGFNVDRPSQIIITSLRSNCLLDQCDRYLIMAELFKIIVETTGKPAKEILIAVRDPL